MKKLIQLAADTGRHDTLSSMGLLILRLASGGMMLFGHGWGKLTGFSDLSTRFPNPLGFGSAPSLALTVFAEVFCAAALMLGLFTRAVALPILFTMLVAAIIVHGDDGFKGMEKALLFAAPYLVLMLTGAGAFSIDSKLARR